MAKQLNVNLAFTADTGQAKAQIQDLQHQLSHLTTSVGAGQTLGLTKELNEAAIKAAELKGLLATSTTSTGNLDLGKFNEGLKKSGMTIKDYAKSLNALGPEGQKAFSQLAQAVTTAEMPMRRANGLLTEMWTTMKNTARWQLTSSMIHGFMGGLQKAVGYAKDLNKTLTDIRIVAPEKSMEDMYQFATLANKQAKELSSTTLDYAKGALIYYQQGLDDITTKERTDVTTKMANVTGDSVDEVSSYMTSIWNNFNKAGDESEEHFADILTKLGAETAASTTEITAALEKYTGVANTIGLSYESATAAATTLIDRLREQPEVAGTALKTIFARLEGLKLEGETSEGGTTTSLNKYSEALHKVGVEIKDANGEIREADDILMDIGEKWNSGELTKDVKIATAETVAGIRQWQQFAALMDNFDYFKQYKDLAATGSEGALQEQQEIYAESWEAASNRVKSSIQTIYMQLLDDKFFIKMTNTIADVVDKVGKLIDGMGGLKTLLPAIGTLMITAFGDKMAKGISDMVYNMRLFGKTGKEEMQKLRQEANEALINQQFGNGYAGKAGSQSAQNQYKIQELIIEKQKNLNELELAQAQAIADRNSKRGEELRLLGQEIDKQKQAQEFETKRAGQYAKNNNGQQVRDLYTEAQKAGNKSGMISGFASQLGASTSKIQETQQAIQKLKNSTVLSEEEKQKQIKETVKVLEQQKAEYKKQVETINQALKEQIGLEKDLLVTGATKKDIKSNSQIMGGYEDAAIVELEQKLIDLRENSTLTGQALEKLRQQWELAGGDVSRFTAALKEDEQALLAEEEAIRNMGNNIPNAAQGLMVLSSVLMEVTMAVNAVKNLDEIWSNEELSTGEKVLETLTAISMILPLIITLTNSENIAKLAGIPISAAKAAGYMTEATAAGLAAKANAGLAGSLIAVGSASKSLLLSPIGAALGILAIAAFAAAKAFKNWYNETHSARIEAEEIKETNQDLNKNLNETKETAEGLSSSLKNVKNAADELKNTEFGSSDWTSKLSEANKESSELIDNYEELRKKAGLLNDEQYDLKQGEDYYIDGSGLRQFTEAGELKIETVKSISVHNADVQLNANQISEDRANVNASVEKLEQSIGQHVEQIDMSRAVKDATDLAHGAYQISNGITSEVQTIASNFDVRTIVEALAQMPNFNADLLNVGQEGERTQDQENNYNMLREAFGEEFVQELQKSEEFQSGIYDVVQQMKGLQEKQVQLYENQLMSNQDVQDKLFDKDKSGLTDAEREKWSGGIVSTMAEDMQRRVDARKGLKENQLIEGQYKTATDARTAFAERNNMTYNAKNQTFTRTGEDGKEETVDHSEYTKQYKEWLATAEAEKVATDNLKKYKAEISDSDKDWKALDKIKKSIQDQEKAIKKASKTLKNSFGGDVRKLFGSTSAEAKKAQKEFNKLADTIKDDLSEALDVDTKNTVIDGKFVAKNLGLIQDAMEGDINALEELRDAYGQAQVDQIMQLHMDDSQLDAIKDQVNEKVADIQNSMDDIAIGATVDDSVIESANQVIAACARTKEEAEAILDGFGISADITDVDIPKDEFESYFDNIRAESYQTSQIPLYNLDIDATETGLQTHREIVGYMPVHGIRYDSDGQTSQKTESPESSVSTWKINTDKGAKPVTKKAVTLPRNTGSRRSRGAPSSGGGGGGSRGGGGRRGGSSRRAERITPSRRQKEKSVILERYKEITDKLDRNARVSERLAKIQDKLYGKDRLSAMDKVNKKHLQEINLLRTKAKEAHQYLLNDKRDAKNALEKALKVAKQQSKKSEKNIFSSKYLTTEQIQAIKNIDGLDFNSYGEITNYTETMSALQDELNALERYYNNPYNFMPKNKKKRKKGYDYASVQEKFKTNKIDPLKEQLEALQEAIDQYDETRELLEELKDQIEDAYTEWQNMNYEKLTYSLELKVTINDNELKYLEHKISEIQDNMYKTAEILDYYFSGTGDTKLNNLTTAITNETNALKELENAYLNGEISQANYAEGLQEAYEKIIGNVEALQELKAEMTDYYSSTLNNAIGELDKYIGRVDHLSALTDHYKTILELTGRANDYNLIESLQGANAMIGTTKLNMSKAEYEMASREVNRFAKDISNLQEQLRLANDPKELTRLRKERIQQLEQELAGAGSEETKAKLQKDLDDLNNMTDEAYRKNLEDQLDMFKKMSDEAINASQETQQEMLSNATDLLQLTTEQLETALARAAKALEKALTGIVGSFDELSRQMGMTSTRQEEYLTKTNQSYELNKMQRTLAKDMDKTDSKAAKARLANFSKELKALEEKDELSNLELEIAQKKYELLKAQIALEDSQNAKSVIRLSRDNEGNYGYVYVANEEAVEDAQQAVENATNDLYNLQLEATNNYGQKYIQAAQEYQAALQEVNSAFASGEINEEERDYRINKLQEQHGAMLDTYADLYEIAYGSTDYLVEALQKDAWVYRNYNNNINLITNNLGEFDTYIDDTNEAVKTFGIQIKNITDTINFEGSMSNILTSTEDTLNKISKDFEDVGEKVTNVLDQVAEQLIYFVSDLIPEINSWIDGTDGLIADLKNLIENAVNGKVDRPTEYFNEWINKFSNGKGILHTDNHVAYTAVTAEHGLGENAANWSADTLAKNEETAKALLEESVGHNGFFGFDKNGVMYYILGTTSKKSDEYKKWIKDFKIVTDPQAFKTGGYTGEWSDNGRLGILHEKELVLNETDTQNILNAVNIVRNNGFLTALNSPSLSSNGSSQALEQNVQIEASFPNATDRFEIEQAFNNLVNRAAQHAFNTRK